VVAVPRRLLRDDACREEGAQDRLDGFAGKVGGVLQRLEAQLADIVAGEHGFEQADSRVRQRLVGAVVRRDGGDEGISTGRHQGCPLAVTKARQARRGHAHPHGKKKGLRNGHDVREALIVEIEFPRHCRMFMARLHWRALAFLGFWVRQAP